MIRTDSIQLACATDARYLPHIATLVESLAASNCADDLHLCLLHDQSVGLDLRKQFAAACAVHGIQVRFIEPTSTQLASLPPSGTYPAVIWFRVLLPELLGSLDKVLYLDADTLVLQDLRPLWSINLAHQFLAAVGPPTPRESVAYLSRLGFSPDCLYFNSGVLLMNLEHMRTKGFAERVFEIGRDRADELSFPDQDALNLACKEQWLSLHPKWNCLAWSLLARGDSLRRIRENLPLNEAMASPAILHFEGSALAKPWHYRSMHPHRDLYRRYRQQTPWPLAGLEGRSIKSRLLKLLPLPMQVALAQRRNALRGLLS